MTTAQILSIVRAKILEVSTDIITDATLLIYANFTIQDIVKRAFLNNQIKTATLTFSSGEATLPTDFGTLYGDAYDDDNNFYPELSIEDFNKKTASKSVTIEGNKAKVYPDTVTSLYIKYYPTYSAVTAVVDPTIDSYFHECIVYGTLYRTFEDLQDESLSDRYLVRYENMLNQKIAVQSNFEEGNQRSSQMFSEQDLLGGGSSFV
jgi:hypothetical protein